ncbi:MAG: PQQ-binding-like beta-propeller repeat protein [Myxococcota bacterium]
MKRSLPLLILLAACGGSAFGPTFPDNDASTLAPIVSRIEQAPMPEATPVAVGITAAPHQLYALDLRSGSPLWQIGVDAPSSAPIIAGNTVLLHQGRGVVGYDLRDGRERFSVEDNAMYLSGAGGEGDNVAFALTTGGGVGARSMLFVARGDRIAKRMSLASTLGAPTYRAGYVLVPWATQNLSILNAETGDEVARVRITDSSVGRAYTVDGAAYFGQLGVFALAEGISSGSRATAPYAELSDAARSLPGDPAFLTDPYSPAPGAASAVHSIRLDHRPARNGNALGFDSDLVYYTFYRLTFGLAPDGAARFVYRNDEDIVGGAAARGGIFLADQAGRLRFVDAQGRVQWSHEGTLLPTAMAIRPGAYTPGGAAADSVPLLTQIADAVSHPDSRLIPARSYALQMLAADSSDDATLHLLGACENRRFPETMRRLACSTLGARSVGGDVVHGALARRYDFIDNTRGPPIAPLAAAAASMQDAALVEPLLRHFRDPATRVEDLPALIQALGSFADSDGPEAVRNWLRDYHVGGEEGIGPALAAAAKIQLAAEGGDEALRTYIADGLTDEPARLALQTELDRWTAEQEAEGQGDDETEGEGDRNGDAEETGPPRATTTWIAEETLAPVMDRIRACIRADERRATTARIALVLEGDGAYRRISVIPQRLDPCITPLVRSVRFEGNSRGVREQVTLTVRR